MTLSRLSYVSVSAIAPGLEERTIAVVADRAEKWNAAQGVTGALIFTGSHFGQALEGPQMAIAGLAKRIFADPRHHSIAVLERDEAATRRFRTRSLVYSGQSVYVQTIVARCLTEQNSRERHTRTLIELMREFALQYDVGRTRTKTQPGSANDDG